MKKNLSCAEILADDKPAAKCQQATANQTQKKILATYKFQRHLHDLKGIRECLFISLVKNSKQKSLRKRYIVIHIKQIMVLLIVSRIFALN